jgi:hypothetical protein
MSFASLTVCVASQQVLVVCVKCDPWFSYGFKNTGDKTWAYCYVSVNTQPIHSMSKVSKACWVELKGHLCVGIVYLRLIPQDQMVNQDN